MEKLKPYSFRDSKKTFFYQNTSSARKKTEKKIPRTLLLQRKFGKLLFRGGGGNTDLFLTNHNSGIKNRSDEQFSVFYSP